jgi:hypothetical protein
VGEEPMAREQQPQVPERPLVLWEEIGPDDHGALRAATRGSLAEAFAPQQLDESCFEPASRSRYDGHADPSR